MFIDPIQPTTSVATKAKLSYDPHTMEVVKKMACVAPLSLWTALNLLEKSPMQDTIALRCDNYYDIDKQQGYEFYSAQNLFSRVEIPLHSGKGIKNTCIDAVETLCDYISKPHKVLFSNATERYSTTSEQTKTSSNSAKTPYELALKK